MPRPQIRCPKANKETGSKQDLLRGFELDIAACQWPHAAMGSHGYLCTARILPLASQCLGAQQEREFYSA